MEAGTQARFVGLLLNPLPGFPHPESILLCIFLPACSQHPFSPSGSEGLLSHPLL